MSNRPTEKTSCDGPTAKNSIHSWAVVVTVACVATGFGLLSYALDSHSRGAETEAGRTVYTAHPSRPSEHTSTVTFEQIKQFAVDGTAIIVDARSNARFGEGHLPGAINVPAQHPERPLPSKLRRLARDMPVVVYCESRQCGYAERVAKRLRKSEIEPVYVYEGGWREWQQQTTHLGRSN